MTRPDPDPLHIAELRRRELDDWHNRRHERPKDDWFFGPIDGEGPVKFDVLAGIAVVIAVVIASVMAGIGVFVTVRFVLGLFL